MAQGDFFFSSLFTFFFVLLLFLVLFSNFCFTISSRLSMSQSRRTTSIKNVALIPFIHSLIFSHATFISPFVFFFSFFLSSFIVYVQFLLPIHNHQVVHCVVLYTTTKNLLAFHNDISLLTTRL